MSKWNFSPLRWHVIQMDISIVIHPTIYAGAVVMMAPMPMVQTSATGAAGLAGGGNRNGGKGMM
jgi:hypothetical protein